MKNKILVGTHHKTGCAWIGNIFQKIAKELKLDFQKNSIAKNNQNWNIFFDGHSHFDFRYLETLNYKGFHIIRDPRDIIISGSFYHCKSDEKWLHIKRKEFGGLTYQEKINSYSNFDDKMLFEMDNCAFQTIEDIKSWNYYNSNFIEVKYENLILDNKLYLFHKIYDFLRFDGSTIPKCLQISYDNSLFSGNIKKGIHVRSGKSQQWEQYFKAIHKKRFVELYGNILINLGYESNIQWENQAIKARQLVK